MIGLDGLRVLVTGASSGIGAAVAERLHNDGAHVFRSDVHPPSAGTGVVGEFLACDVTSEADVARLVGTASDVMGRIDGLVLCAGIHWAGPTHEMSAELFDRVLAVHVRGTFLCCRAALPAMIAQGSGKIVTLGSTAAVSGAAKLSAYAAAKGAVLQLTRSIAVEYAQQGIRANCLCPGATDTPLLGALLSELATEGDEGQQYIDSIPAARFAAPSEIAAAAAFLLSDEVPYLMGSTFLVDGGFTAG